jgi:uncharacterized protein YggE
MPRQRTQGCRAAVENRSDAADAGFLKERRMRKIVPLALAAVLALPLGAQAQETPPTPRIVVAGEGEVAIRPDMAWINLSVTREADTARAALDDANEAVAGVIAALKQAGIGDRDLQTSGLSIDPRYVYPQNNDGTQQPRIVGYQVTNSLTVRVRDLARVGEVIDRAVTLGVNQGGGIVFDNDDPKDAVTEARKRAVADAAAKARTLAEAAGVGLGRVIEIAESSPVDPPVPMPKVMRMEAADAAAVPIEAGENTYRIQVRITYEIAQP